MIQLSRIISGGQTGADRAGLEAAVRLSLNTGGWAPRGYLTENGPDLTLKDFGLKEHWSPQYPPRTKLNIETADATVIFGDIRSQGSQLTKRHCRKVGKPHHPIDLQQTFDDWAEELIHFLTHNNVETLNVAGNRESRRPGIHHRVENFLVETLSPYLIPLE